MVFSNSAHLSKILSSQLFLKTGKETCSIKREVFILCIILFLTFILRLLWSYHIPHSVPGKYMNSAPDESSHLTAAASLAHGDFPLYRPFLYRLVYCNFLPVPYLLHALFGQFTFLNFDWLYQFNSSNNEYMLLRMGSHVLGVLTVFFGYLLARKHMGVTYAQIFSLILCFYPQLVFVNSYINSDSYSIMAATLLIYTWSIYNTARKPYLLRLLLTAMGFLLITVGKLSTFYFFPVFGIVILYDAVAFKEYRNFSIGLGIYVLLLTPFLLYGNSRYPGDPFGVIQFTAFQKHVGKTGFEYGYPLIHYGFFKMLFHSAFAYFRNMDLTISPIWVKINYLFMGTGFFLTLKRAAGFAKRKKIFFITLFLSVLLNVLLTWWNSFTLDYQPQGRYLLGSLPALLLFFLYSFSREERTSTKVITPFLYVIFIIVSSTVSLLFYVIPNPFSSIIL